MLYIYLLRKKKYLNYKKCVLLYIIKLNFMKRTHSNYSYSIHISQFNFF